MAFSFTVPGPPEQDEIAQHVQRSLPRWFLAQAGAEVREAVAAVLAIAKRQVDDWVRMTYIRHAHGKWLLEHAWERSVYPQDGESEDELRERVRTPEEALTAPSLLEEANRILYAAGVEGGAALVEMPRDRAHCGVYEADAGTGGRFEALAGDEMSFAPDGGWARSPRPGDDLVISDAASGGNSGTFAILRLAGDAVVYENASGVGEHDAGVSWASSKRHPAGGEVTDGFARAFFGRGYRMGRGPHLVMILPKGTTEGTAASVRQSMTDKAAGGRTVSVERDLSA